MTKRHELVVSATTALTEGEDTQALVYATLAAAQQQKVANIIAYLNSDREAWSETDDAYVRDYLGLG